MSKTFADLIAKVNECGTKKVAVAVAQDSAVLEAVKVAKERRIADAILVGDEAKIREIAASLNIDLNDFEIVHVEDVTEAARTAVKLVHEGKADMYMKGLIDTKGFLKSVLDKEVGLRTGKPLSHVCVFDVEGIDHLLFLTDVAFIPYPTLEDKVNIIKNTLEITKACGIENPKVAPLAAVRYYLAAVWRSLPDCWIPAILLRSLRAFPLRQKALSSFLPGSFPHQEAPAPFQQAPLFLR